LDEAEVDILGVGELVLVQGVVLDCCFDAVGSLAKWKGGKREGVVQPDCAGGALD
jgi:hypothetical protein